MILHFSAYLCARGVRGTRNRNVLRAGAMKAISGMVLAGDLACLRIGSPAAAPVAAAHVELYRSVRRRTPFCLLGSRILGHPRQRMGAGPERATNDSSYMTLERHTQRERKWGAHIIDACSRIACPEMSELSDGFQNTALSALAVPRTNGLYPEEL